MSPSGAPAPSPALVFAIPAYEQLADDVAAASGLMRGKLERSEFPDGEHYLRVCDEVLNRDTVIVGGTISDKATLEIY
ncbi:MAG: ribose-phosphate pyrophosphokinase-like domain-containing protein, partial [Thermoanaerobaculia bacterium]